MKFTKSEFDSFSQILSESGFSPSTTEFVKKKGWLSISPDGMDSQFKYHRSTSTGLNSHGSWSNVTCYSVEIDSEKSSVSSFEEVLSLFRNWLK